MTMTTTAKAQVCPLCITPPAEERTQAQAFPPLPLQGEKKTNKLKSLQTKIKDRTDEQNTFDQVFLI